MKWGGAAGWSPFNGPATAHGYDDEFADASLSASWTEWDVPNVLTVSETARGLEMVCASVSTACYSGIFKDVPASPYTVWAYVPQDITRAAGGGSRGLVFGACMGACPNTSDIYLFQYSATASSLDVNRWNSYQGDGGVTAATYTGCNLFGGIFVRWRYASQSASFDWSKDGLSWLNFGASAINFAPSNMGFYVHHSADGVVVAASSRAFFPFFRVISGSLWDTVMEGNR